MIALTGIGPVTPIGVGKEHFWNNVINRCSGIKKLIRFLSYHGFYCGEISKFSLDEYIQDSRFRRAADISKYALVATSLAINDAHFKKLVSEDTAIVLGTTNGPLTYTQQFHSSLIREGIDAISPSLFSESVLNAPASNISICSGIRGPVQTLVGGPTISIKSIILACQMVSAGVADKAIVVSSEELNELSFFYYSQLGNTLLSEGAGAVVIEKVTRVKESFPYCYLSGMASHCNPLNPGDALSISAKQCLEMAGLTLKDIDFLMVDSFLPAVRNLYQDIIPSGCITRLTGNAFSVTSMWHIILSSLSLKHGEIPASVRTDMMKISDNIKHVMICSAEEKGVAAAIILSKYI
jgi:3-oxoacyl-[acyl-carrier-protein] synthase II